MSAPIPFLLVLFFSTGLSLYLMGIARRSLHVPGAKEFFFLSMAVAFYTAGYALEISQVRLEDVLWAVRFEYLGIPFIPPLILLTTQRLVHPKSIPLWGTALLFVIPLGTLGLALTIPAHSLFYIEPHMVQNPFYTGLTFERGVWYWVNLIYQLLAGVLAPLILLTAALHASPRRRRSFLLMGVGILIPFVVSMAYALELTPKGVDPIPFALACAVSFFALAILRTGLFDILPRARELALDGVQEGILVLDGENRVVYVNQALRRLMEEQDWQVGFPLPQGSLMGEAVRSLLAEGRGQAEVIFSSEQNGMHEYQIQVYPILDAVAKEEGKTVLIRDITETRRLIRTLNQQATTDELTGVYNRRYLIELGETELAKARQISMPFTVVLMDLDRFKQINDRFGHAVGDRALQEVARCFKAGVRSSDIVGRYGGDEFALILFGATEEQARQVLERLQNCMERLGLQEQGEPLHISVSFGGVTCNGRCYAPLDELLRRADCALYRAKEQGGKAIEWFAGEEEEQEQE